MAQGLSEAVLGSPTAKLIINDLLPLGEQVGTGAFSVPADKLKLQSGTIPVFDQVLTLDASMQGTLEILNASAAAIAFDSGDGGFTAPAESSFAELTLAGKAVLAGQASSHTPAGLSLSLGLEAGAELRYRHLLPVAQNRSRLDAFKRVTAGSALPQRIDFTRLAAGEVHELTALIYLDLGMKIAAGGDAVFIGDLFRDLPSPVRFHVQYVAEASLGLSIYERMKITAGRALLIDPKRVRLRVERESRRQLTLGASFSLQLQYNLAGGFESLLEEALDLLPFRRAMGTLRTVRGIVKEVGSSDWQQIKARLTEKAAAEVTEFLGDAKWLAWADNSQEVKDFLELSQKAVKAFDDLDDRLQSLWTRLLGRTGLTDGSEARTLLERLAALDPKRPERLLDQDLHDLIAGVEILSGKSLEEILLASGASADVEEVRDLAREALRFIKDAPQGLLTKIDSFAGRTGIQKTIDWLRANATSLDKLKATAEAQVIQVVQRLTGKALDQIGAQDFNQIRQWAATVGNALGAPEQIEERLRSRIQSLRGEAGFSVAVELDRLSRTTAVLDLEFDPQDDDTRQAAAKIGQSDLGGILRDLPAGSDRPDKAETFPYQLRECVFTSRRVRTSAVNLFFSWFGWTKSRRQQVEEVVLQLTQSGTAFTREAVYSGGAVLTSQVPGVSSTAAVWLISNARGSGKDLAAQYNSVDREMRLTFSREDEKTTVKELEALETLLNNLGFTPKLPDELFAAGAPVGGSTRFSIDLRLPESAVDTFWGNLSTSSEEKQWAFDVLNALHRWFDEPLVSDEVQVEGERRPSGKILSSALREKNVRDAWITGRPDLDREAMQGPVELVIGGQVVPVQLATRRPNGDAEWRTLVVLPITRSHYAFSLPALRDASKQVASKSRKPADLAALNRTAAKSLLALQPSPGLWSSPLLGMWLLLSRLAAKNAEALQEARGVAALRWKGASGEWSPEILTWRLAAGLKAHDRQSPSGMFPIVK
jgi:hypothetical protein